MGFAQAQIDLAVNAQNGTATLKIVSSEFEKLTTAVQRSDGAVQNFEQRFVASMNNARNVGQGFTEAMRALDSVYGNGVRSAMQYELAQAKLFAVLKSGGKDAEITMSRLDEIATKISKTDMFSKQDIMDIERYFLTFKNIGGASIEQATEAVIGLSETLDMNDSRAATIALAKALDQGVEGMKALNRMGLKLSQDELDHVQVLEDEGKTYEMQAYIIELLSDKYRALDEQVSGTSALALNQAEKSFKSVQREAGNLLILGLGPTMKGFTDFVGAINKLDPVIKGFIGLAAETTIALGLLNSTGIGKNILTLMQLGPSYRTVTLAMAEKRAAAISLGAAEEAEAISAMYAAEANTAWWASMGPIGWITIAVGALATAWGLFGDKIMSADEAMSDDVKQLGVAKAEFISLGNIIGDTTKKEDERKKAIEDMQTKYPDYLKNKTLDLNNEKDMNDTLKEGNKLFDERIRMKSLEKQKQSISDERGQIEADIVLLKDQQKNASTEKPKTTQAMPAAQGSSMVSIGGGMVTGESEYETLQNKINEKQKKYDELDKKYNTLSNALIDKKSGGQGEKPDTTAKNLLAKNLGGLTNEAIDRYVDELQKVDKKLVAGGELSNKIKAKLDSLKNNSRYGKTGGSGLGYLTDDTKIDLENLTELSDMYAKMQEKWTMILGINVKNSKGIEDVNKTKEKQQKARYNLRNEFEKVAQSFMGNQIKSAEGAAEAEGGDKLAGLEAKANVIRNVITQVQQMNDDWVKSHPDFPLISKQKMQELGNELVKVNNDINKEQFTVEQKALQRESDQLDQSLENMKATDIERLAWKAAYLQKQLALAQQFKQKEKELDIQGKIDLIPGEETKVLDRMKTTKRDTNYDIEISRQNRAYNKTGSTSGLFMAEYLEEEKKYKDQVDKVKNDTTLGEGQKYLLLEEMEAAHGDKMLEIRRKYYDSLLGDVIGFGAKELEATQKALSNVESAVGNMYKLQEAKGKAVADGYRTTENDKADTDKKAELAKARTAAQKEAIEEKYTKRKEKIDEEAKRKGQEKVKTLFAIQKAVQIANAFVNTYSGATAALAPPPLGAGPIMGPIIAGTTIAAGLANIAVIAAQDLPKFAEGTRYVEGPGDGKSDSILAMLSRGERVIPADMNARYGLLFDNIMMGRHDNVQYNPATFGAINAMYTTTVSVDNKGTHDRLERVETAITNLHEGMASGGILAKVTSDQAARIVAAGLAALRKTK